MADALDTTPRQITRAAYLDMVKAAGFDVDDLVSLRFAADGIYAEVFARDPETGKRLRDREDVARHTVYVQVVD